MPASARFVTTLPRPVAGFAFPALLLLGGCSGLGHFLGDTETLPGYNPNGTTGISENLQRARGHEPATQAMLPQSGNVWPGPPQPLPTLGDVSRGSLGGGSDVLGGGATMPRGGSMSMGEQNAVHGGAPLGEGFSGGLSETIPDPAARYQHGQTGGGAAQGAGAGTGGGTGAGSSTGTGGGAGGSSGGGGNIVIPNGDGTSTIISPDGSVRTVKGTPR